MKFGYILTAFSFSVLITYTPMSHAEKSLSQKLAQKQIHQEKVAAKKAAIQQNNAVQNLAKNESKVASLQKKIDQEEAIIADLQKQKALSCANITTPCVFDEVISAAQNNIKDLKNKQSQLQTKDQQYASLCSQAVTRVQDNVNSWESLVNDLMPIRNQIVSTNNQIKQLRETQRKSNVKYWIDFQRAINKEEQALINLHKNLDHKYQQIAGAKLAAAQNFHDARVKTIHLENKLGRIRSICANANLPESVSGSSPEINQNFTEDNNGSSSQPVGADR